MGDLTFREQANSKCLSNGRQKRGGEGMEGCYCGNGTYITRGVEKEIINNTMKFVYESLPENLRTTFMMKYIVNEAEKEIDNRIVTISFQ